jgi:hypothetical protein
VSRTPAAELARLKDTYGARWQITRQGGYVEAASGPGGGTPVTYTAISRTSARTLRDSTAAGLERQIVSAEGRGPS